jgi:outer membrane protein assembly factor BamB
MSSAKITNWTSYRFDENHSGFVDSDTIVKTLHLKWKFQVVNEIHSSPLIHNGIAYVGCWGHIFYAIDIETRKVIWKFNTGFFISDSAFINDSFIILPSGHNLYFLDHNGNELFKYTIDDEESFMGISSSPIVNNGVVYFCSFWFLYAVNIDTLELIWKFESQKTGSFESNTFNSTPIISGDVIYVTSNIYLYALNVITGDVIYKFKTNHYIDNSPVIKGDKIFFGGVDRVMYCLEKSTGLIYWKFNADSSIITAPAIDETTIFFGCLDGTFYSLNILTGKLNWKFKTEDCINSSPIVYGESVFFGSDKIYGLNKNTGSEFWNFSSKRGKERGFVANPVVIDDMLFIGGMDNQFYVFNIENQNL